MLIYIRHACDEDDDPTHAHDRHITTSGRRRAFRRAKRLIKRYGRPDEIRYSPFQRTRETLRAMATVLPGVKFIADTGLSRYFSAREQKDPQVDPTTKKQEIPIYETKHSFRQRVDTHIADRQKHKGKLVWCITHALVYKWIAKHYKIRIPRNIPFLDYFKIKAPKPLKPKQPRQLELKAEPERQTSPPLTQSSIHKSGRVGRSRLSHL
jgi:broad specificity phosphatase PhoE